MLNLIRNVIGSQKLLTSMLCNQKGFYWFFLQDLRKARRSLVIESPYLTVKRAKYFFSLFNQLRERGVSVQIHTRHPLLHDSTMRTQAEKSIKILTASRAEIHLHSDLRHWKLAAIDNAILWEGSLNILSHAGSKEVMRRTDSPYLCRRMLHFIRANK